MVTWISLHFLLSFHSKALKEAFSLRGLFESHRQGVYSHMCHDHLRGMLSCSRGRWTDLCHHSNAQIVSSHLVLQELSGGAGFRGVACLPSTPLHPCYHWDRVVSLAAAALHLGALRPWFHTFVAIVPVWPVAHRNHFSRCGLRYLGAVLWLVAWRRLSLISFTRYSIWPFVAHFCARCCRQSGVHLLLHLHVQVMSLQQWRRAALWLTFKERTRQILFTF